MENCCTRRHPYFRLLTLIMVSCCWIGSHPAMAKVAAPVRIPEFWHDNLHHTAWTKKDGAPGLVYAMAQDAQGRIWFAADDGFYQFDGVHFELASTVDGNPLLSSAVTIVATHNDAIWVSYQFGGVTRFEHGQARHYTTADGLPASTANEMQATPAGTIWVNSRHSGLFWLARERWHQVTAADGLPEKTSGNISVLDDGSLLLCDPVRGVYRSLPESHRFRRISTLTDIDAAFVRHDGSYLLFSERAGVYAFDERTGVVTKVSIDLGGRQIKTFAMDRRGAFWLNTAHSVVLLDQSLRVMREFSRADGFSEDNFGALLDDREGNLWFATKAGIDRIRASRLHQVVAASGVTIFGIAPGENATVWIGNTIPPPGEDGPLSPAFGIARDGRRLPTKMTDVQSGYQDAHGNVWFASKTTLWRLAGNTWSEWPLPVPTKMGVQAMAMDSAGVLWVSILRQGIYTFNNGVWLASGGNQELPRETYVSLAHDRQGNLWLGQTNNRLIRLYRGVVQQYSSKNGIDVGAILAMQFRSGRFWIGGEAGLAYLDGDRFVQLKDIDNQSFRGVSGIVATADGALWLHGLDGISRIGAADLRRAIATHTNRVAFERFDYLDGLEGTAVQIRPLPSLVEATDGRIWYATRTSVGWIDPARRQHNTLAPSVLITRLNTDQNSYPLIPDLALPAGTRSLQLRYTATALSIPERIRFRFRLLGVDDTWRPETAARQAAYTNLGPGSYTFQVVAANEDGVWNAAGARQTFRILPLFWQTAWFRILCAGLFLLACYALYLWRLARVTAQLHARMHERLSERGRIARALHDTFLQSLYGLGMHLQSVTNSLPQDSMSRGHMEKILNETDKIVVEGRNQVMDLRVSNFYDGNLGLALAELASDMATQSPASFATGTVGTERTLAVTVRDEVFNIGREALFNSLRHAQAQTVTLELVYDHAHFCLRVHDDGIGIDAGILAAGNRPGHWGLAGMRERALSIGATLSIVSDRGAPGTALELKIPGHLAYMARPRFHRVSKLLKMFQQPSRFASPQSSTEPP